MNPTTFEDLLMQRIVSKLQPLIDKENTPENQVKMAEAVSDLVKFEIVCDETNNNEETRRENRLVCDLHLSIKKEV